MSTDDETPAPPTEDTEPKRRGLGRGLSALLGDESEDYAELDRVRIARMVPVEFIYPGNFQPRGGMEEEGLTELAESIRVKGILQPLLVRRRPDEPNRFEIIAGERRWRAAQRAELHEVPVIVKELTDPEALEIALVENLQREDLSPLEEAGAYRRLLDEFDHTQEDLARVMGKSRSHVANSMRLLSLPDPVKDLLKAGKLTAGHARALLNADDPVETARTVVRRALNVRQTERLVASGRDHGRPGGRRSTEKDPDTLELEDDLSRLLGLRVRISPGRQGGNLTIHYKTFEQLDEVVGRLTRHDLDEPGMPGRDQGDALVAIDPSEDFATLTVGQEPGDEMVPVLDVGPGDNEITPIDLEPDSAEDSDDIEPIVFDTEGDEASATDSPDENFLGRVEELLAADDEFGIAEEPLPGSRRDDAETLIADVQALLDAEEPESADSDIGGPAAPTENRAEAPQADDIDPETVKFLDELETMIGPDADDAEDAEDAEADKPNPPEKQD